MDLNKFLEFSDWLKFVGFVGLVLGIVNGLMLFKNYINDRPKLVVRAVHPESYQWWFKLPDGACNGSPTRRYGFLAYLDVINRGLRRVSLDSWRLKIKTQAFAWLEFKAINIPEPKAELGKSGNIKIWPVLGQKGTLSDGSTLVDSGSSVSGMTYYVAEFYGNDLWNPVMKDKNIIGKICIKDIFGGQAKTSILFKEVPLSYVQGMIEGVEKIVG
jgi:hypothetical protein